MAVVVVDKVYSKQESRQPTVLCDLVRAEEIARGESRSMGCWWASRAREAVKESLAFDGIFPGS